MAADDQNDPDTDNDESVHIETVHPIMAAEDNYMRTEDYLDPARLLSSSDISDTDQIDTEQFTTDEEDDEDGDQDCNAVYSCDKNNNGILKITKH